MSSEQSHRHHYVTEWYQKRFLPPGTSLLHLLDLHPEKVQVSPQKQFTKKAYYRRAPSMSFCKDDLYMLRFGRSTTDFLEKNFFGEIDRRGAPAVEAFSKIAGFTPDIASAFNSLAPYMGAQRFRTPRGLDWLSGFTRSTDPNKRLMLMQQVFQQHTTMWTEGVWEIVSAAQSPTKFIISDEPVTFYNPVLYFGKVKYPGSEELPSVGTRTLFPLGPDACLIITHVQYIRDTRVRPESVRVNARQYDQTLIYMGNIQFGRQLTEDEVLRVNLVLKRKASKYIAAGEREWLYPEERLKKTGWATLDDDWFLLPNPWKVPFTSSIIVGNEDGSSWARDDYGRHPGHPQYRDKARREREWVSRALTQKAWSKKRAGKSLSHTYEKFLDAGADKQMENYLASIQPKRQKPTV